MNNIIFVVTVQRGFCGEDYGQTFDSLHATEESAKIRETEIWNEASRQVFSNVLNVFITPEIVNSFS